MLRFWEEAEEARRNGGDPNPHFSSPHHPDWQICPAASGLQGATDGRQIHTLCSGAEAPRGLKPTLHCVSTIDGRGDEKCGLMSAVSFCYFRRSRSFWYSSVRVDGPVRAALSR
jgi:hypothetical protein